jgi:16S rRNA (adenine(1408)-N(1))-methyltransferase
MFVVAAIEQPPVGLACRADDVSIAFPWGSLLRGTLALDVAAAAGIASFVRPGGRVVAHVSITARDGLDLPPIDQDVDALARRWSSCGLTLKCVRRATIAEVAATGSSWARRLTSDPTRQVWRIELIRPQGPSDDVLPPPR